MKLLYYAGAHFEVAVIRDTVGNIVKWPRMRWEAYLIQEGRLTEL